MSDAKLPGHAAKNINTVRHLEHEFVRRRSRGERVIDRARDIVGSFAFLAAQSAAVVAWVVVNLGLITGVPVFDPYPFYLLALIVGVEAILLSVGVLMAQNRQSRQAEHWGHLQLQFSILAEQETTKVLELLRSMSGADGSKWRTDDPTLDQMSQTTDVEELATHLRHAREETHKVGH